MKQPLKTILISGIISIAFLIIFFLLQLIDSKVLTLDDKWLIVSGIPILVGLILSGVVKSFKAFGVELETNLSEKVEIGLIASVESLDSPKITKQSLQDFHNISDTRKKSIERIQFIIGRKNYYENFAVQEYLQALGSLQFIEIINDKKEFVALLPSSYYCSRHRRDMDRSYERIQTLIREIEDESIKNNKNAVTDKIRKGDSLTEAFRKFEQSNQGLQRIGGTISNREINEQILPVIDNNDKMIGITKRTKLTEKISRQVLKSEK